MAAIILAAGRGGRLGAAAKGTLLLPGGDTFLSRIAATARAAGCGRIVVVAAQPHIEVTEVAARAAGADEIVVNPTPERGMASSLACGLAALGRSSWDAALAWPVDHPLVRAATVERIVAAATRDCIVIPCVGERGGHPTAFGNALWDELAAAVELPGGARAVVARDPNRVRRFDSGDAGAVEDIDDGADYARLLDGGSPR